MYVLESTANSQCNVYTANETTGIIRWQNDFQVVYLGIPVDAFPQTLALYSKESEGIKWVSFLLLLFLLFVFLWFFDDACYGKTCTRKSVRIEERSVLVSIYADSVSVLLYGVYVFVYTGGKLSDGCWTLLSIPYITDAFRRNLLPTPRSRACYGKQTKISTFKSGLLRWCRRLDQRRLCLRGRERLVRLRGDILFGFRNRIKE